jgi:tRNA threonylcarbamoyladenosine biosynthesis protein TsaB
VALLLSFDTATSYLAVVLSKNDQPCAWRVDATPALSHAEQINVFIAEVMQEAGCSLKELDGVAVGIGPGSYTGLRIGLSAAKGLCFVLGKPLLGMGTLEVLVESVLRMHGPFGPHDILVPMVDARRMEVYHRVFGADGLARGETAPLILDEAWCRAQQPNGTVHVFGDGADKAAGLWLPFPWILHHPDVRPGTHGLAGCADRHFRNKQFSDLAYVVPEYGKPANVAQKRGAE